MPSEPLVKRAVAFIDGQNLYHAARESFGYTYPNFDVNALSLHICRSKGWELNQVRFYTGVPDKSDDSFWNYFWHHKLAMLGRQGVVTCSRSLRYRNQRIKELDFLMGPNTPSWSEKKKGLTSESPLTSSE